MLIFLGRLIVLMHFIQLKLTVFLFGLEKLVQRIDTQVQIDLDAD